MNRVSTPDYEGPDRRTLTAEDVEQMREATADLSRQVEGLSGTLSQVNELQRRQLDLENRQRETQETVHDQQELGDHLVGHLNEIDEVSARRLVIQERLRKMVLVLSVLIVIGVGVGVFLLREVTRINQVQVNYCNLRNDSIQGAIQREKDLAKSDPASAPAHLASVLSLQRSIGKC